MKYREMEQAIAASGCGLFSFEDLRAFFPRERRESLRQSLSRWMARGWIGSLRRGQYELTAPRWLRPPDLLVANRIYEPSYVSLETALSRYGIIPEVAMAVVSVTSRPTRRFKNDHGLFLYRTVRPEAFRGYVIERHGGWNVLIAEPEKALIDYVHFKTLRGRRFDADAERIDRKRVARLDREKLDRYSRIYRLDWKGVLNA